MICSATKTNCLFMASFPFHTQDTGFTMPHHSEEPTAYYTLFIHFEGQRHTVTVYEIEMDGWHLFECFIPAADTVVYLSREEGENDLQCVDMDDAADEQYAALIIEALKPFARAGLQ